MADPVLDIATLIERPLIKIDGTAYEILSPDEISVVDHQRFASWGRRIDALTQSDRLSDDERAELSKVLTALSDRIMVGVPAEARAKLSDSHRLSVAEVFTKLPLINRLTAMAAGAKAAGSRSTGAKRRRSSKGSTAARPAGGSPKPRSRSSART